MDSNSDKLTNKENMSGEPSLASIESGFVSLTGSKAKETVNGGNDLEIEKNKDAKILVENGGNDIKNDKKEKTNKLQVFFLIIFG
ncbi:unnamed protein product [Meloidogyne enterolobii]|uniref:Uncharacterized protein n=1 Tax=Meloidogyne enterolobii TaxID=390850 RepID=A0ACB1AVQ0_MELEN